MRTRVPLAVLLVACGQAAFANGLLIPEDKKVPPLAMVSHKVAAAIDDQVAVTTVEQVFRNHTDRPLEATYLFPVPRGASVNKFILWVDGKETSGELLDAKKASQVYTDIVRRTQDPGLLEYLGNDLMRMRVFPVPPKGDQKVKLQFTSVAQKDAGVVEYVYPMKTDGKATRTLEDFSVRVTIKSQHPVQSVYSPTHAITTTRKGDRQVYVDFERNQALLDKDFQLFYGTSESEIGVTPILYRPVSADDGYVMLLISPQVEATKASRVPRDVVLVIDKSGSMSELKMSQARKALKFCLGNLTDKDRFALVAFSTTVTAFRDDLAPAAGDHLERANKWVDDIRASGGTAILPALNKALEFRTTDPGRSFTVVFFTDGLPTVDETNPDKIVKAVAAKNTANTRIFTFGVGDDVNAAMLDQLADTTRAVSTYVRPAEDIEAKVSSLHAKISHPVMTDVKLTAAGVRLHEVYQAKLPDLFHGGQLVVIGKFAGQGPATIKLSGMVGSEPRELIEEVTFPARTDNGKEFVEHLWARRKVGYLLDQIRANGEQKELVEEVTALAKKYGIATPYTSYLVVPDAPLPVAAPGRAAGAAGRSGVPAGGGVPPGFGFPGGPAGGFGPAGLGGSPDGGAPKTTDVARRAAEQKGGAGGVAAARGGIQSEALERAAKELSDEQRRGAVGQALEKARQDANTLKLAELNFRARNLAANQTGTQGVNLALASGDLRNQTKLTQTANRQVQGRNCVEVGGVWIDDRFDPKMPTVAVKAQSDAYFRILERQPQVKDVYRLGNNVLWVTPSGTALVLDPNDGKDKLADEEIDKLFAAKK